MMKRPLVISAFFLCTVAVACAPLGRGVEKAGSRFHEESVAMDHKVRDWFDSENIEMRRRGNIRLPDTAFCYRTLGDISCYDHPIPGEERRLVGVQMPEPQFDELSIPIPDEKPEPPVLVVEAEQVALPTEGVVAAPEVVMVQELPQSDARAPVIRTYEPNKPRELMPLLTQ